MTEREAGAEIEVTPEMLKAGEAVYFDWAAAGDYEVTPTPVDFLRRLHAAMEGARR